MRKAYLQVYTGDGKGKTTASLGLSVRAAGRGMRVFIGQVMQGGDQGAVKALPRFEEIPLGQFGEPGIVRPEELPEGERGRAR